MHYEQRWEICMPCLAKNLGCQYYPAKACKAQIEQLSLATVLSDRALERTGVTIEIFSMISVGLMIF